MKGKQKSTPDLQVRNMLKTSDILSNFSISGDHMSMADVEVKNCLLFMLKHGSKLKSCLSCR